MRHKVIYICHNNLPHKTMPVIHCLLPAKEHYTRENAGAVAMVTEDTVLASRDGANSHVFGRISPNPPLTENFTALRPRSGLFYGQNIGMARAYLHHLSTTGLTPDWVEVHGRCQVAAYLAQHRPDLNIVLVLHNDPREMKGSKTVKQRQTLAKQMKGVFAVSQYLLDAFHDGLTAAETSHLIQQVTPLGIDPRHKTLPKKKKQIVITGRMVPEKGMLEAAKALAQVLPRHPEWSARFIGARSFADSQKSAYEKAVAHALAPLGDQAVALGFLPMDAVYREQDDAAIAIVPSQWQEPAGRVVLEAMVAGAALITGRRGGIPEYAEGRALICDDPTPEAMANALEQLISSPTRLHDYQQLSWTDYPFTRAHHGHSVDQGRDAVQAQFTLKTD